MFELLEVLKAYKDAKNWIEQADNKLKELENKIENKNVIRSVYDQNMLLLAITSNLAKFFEEIFSEGEGKFNPIVSSDLIKDLMKKTNLSNS